MNNLEIKLRKLFLHEFSYINNKKTCDKIIEIMLTLDNDFFTLPTSSTGKYHPQDCNKKYGIILHIKIVCQYSFILCNAVFKGKELDVKLRVIITAAILHDIAKKRYYKGKEYNLHPVNAVAIIKEHINSSPLFNGDIDEIYMSLDLIKNHMGIFSDNSFRKDINEYSIEEVVLYLADYLASRRSQNHDPWIEDKYKMIYEVMEK